MIPYKLDLVIEEVSSAQLAAQGLLQAYTGKVIPKWEAEKVWHRIPDHKWYLSERLGRDVGMRVAAVDFVENFYEPAPRKTANGRLQKLIRNARPRIGSWISNYFVAKDGLTYL
ncbi:MAG: DUF4032 domain-containing protein [Acidobacteriota bacterium]